MQTRPTEASRCQHKRETKQWYVVQVRSGSEERACALLSKMIASSDYGHGGGSQLRDTVDEWFVPKYRIATYRNNCLQESEQPLFPGYIIVVSSDVDTLRSVLYKTPAFMRLLGTGDSFIPLNNDEIAWICAFTQRDHRVIGASVGYIEKGRITVVRGPLVGREAHVVKINRRKGFALIKLQMCGREVETRIGLNVIKQEKALQQAAGESRR